jgi:hypothetical protein
MVLTGITTTPKETPTMSTTFTLPSGRKARYQGHFRYVVIQDDPAYRVRIVKRSDNLAVANRVASSYRFNLLYDTVTKAQAVLASDHPVFANLPHTQAALRRQGL